MRTLVAILTTMALILASGSQALFAQEQEKIPSDVPMTPQQPGARPMGEVPMTPEGEPVAVPRASEIIGLAVTNDEHQDLGKVEDLILGSDGRISYLVVSKGGFIGIGADRRAIPWQASNPRIHESALLVNISKEQFEGAPTFANWDDFKEGGYESKVRAYYGEGVGFEGQKEKPMEKMPEESSSY